MSMLSTSLRRLGVPKEVLDALQKVIDSGKVDANEIVAAWKQNLVAQIPTASALVDSIKRQPDFKRMYRALPAEGQAAVDRALLTICECALAKLHKALGL